MIVTALDIGTLLWAAAFLICIYFAGEILRNFDVMAMFHSAEDAAQVARWVEGFFDRCTSDLPPPTPLRWIAEGIIRLFAPIL